MNLDHVILETKPLSKVDRSNKRLEKLMRYEIIRNQNRNVDNLRYDFRKS